MFTWICPQCGKEVPPHENDCPFCREKAEGGERSSEGQAAGTVQEQAPPGAQQPPVMPPAQQVPVPPPAQQPPMQQPVTQQAPPQYAQPQPPQAAPPQQQVYEIGRRQRGMPGWAVTLLVAIGLTAVGGAFYYWIYPAMKGANRPAPQEAIAFEEVPEAQPAPVARGRVARQIEVTGFRFTEDANKRPQVQFLVVNHSAADIGDLEGKVTLRKAQSGEDDDPITEFEFNTTRLAPYASIEFKTLIRTSLRAYEMPDWQFLRAEVEITSPKEL